MTQECFNISHLDLVFGKNPNKAFHALDTGKSRDQIHKELNQIVAVRKVSFKVYQGEILVIMGLSGSGKSSLAFDTLYAEGQRRYLESLSTYARTIISDISEATHVREIR